MPTTSGPGATTQPWRGKMHFVGDQLHGYEQRLTSDIYPGDFGWAVNWDEPDTRLEWYHNASSILQAGPCGRSNQLDYDEEVMYRSTQYLWDHVREGPDKRPFALTVSSEGGSEAKVQPVAELRAKQAHEWFARPSERICGHCEEQRNWLLFQIRVRD